MKTLYKAEALKKIVKLEEEIERLKIFKEPEIIVSPVRNIDDLCDEIASSILKKEGWKPGNYSLDRGGLKIWISNGINNVAIDAPIAIKLSDRNKKLLWDAYTNFQTNPPMSILYKLFSYLS